MGDSALDRIGTTLFFGSARDGARNEENEKRKLIDEAPGMD